MPSFLQSSKELFLINFISASIITVLRLSFDAAKPIPRYATVLGITNSSKDIHSAYLQPVITQYFVRNKSEICHRPLRVHSKG